MRRNLSVGETLSETFSIYGQNAGVLMPIAFWLFLLVAIVDGLTRADAVLYPLTLAVSFVAGTLYQGMVVGLVRDVHDDGRRDISMAQVARSALPVLGPLIGAGLLSGLGIAGGFVLLIVPGLYLLTIWAVIAPVIVVERRDVFDAFGRSRLLVRGNGWPVFGSVLVGFVIAAAGALLLGGIAEEISNGPIVRIVFSAIASTVTAPVAALVAAVLYYRLLEIEGEAPASPPHPPAPAP